MPSGHIDLPTGRRHSPGIDETKILHVGWIVRDNRFVCKLLESDELSVDTVSSAQEALTALGESDYSVLITDLNANGKFDQLKIVPGEQLD